MRAGMAILLAMLPALAQSKPEPGSLLLATERNSDSGFAATVIVVLVNDSTRTVGLVVNRRLGEPVSTLFPQLRNLPAAGAPLWAGGPVALGVNALVRSGIRPPGASEVARRVYLVGEGERIRGLLRSPPAGAEIRIYVGLSSWGPRQLNDELRRGLWRSVAGSAAVVFNRDPDTLWPRLIKKAPSSR